MGNARPYYGADEYAKQYYNEAKESGKTSKVLTFEQSANNLVGLHIAVRPESPVGGKFLDDSGKLIKWSLVDEGLRIVFKQMLAQAIRLKLAEAALYVNERLTRPWTNPKSAFESNVYRGRIKISRHGRKNNKRTFLSSELDRFIKAKNESATPTGGQAQKDLSACADLFGYHSDRHIATVADCSSSTVVRYRKAHDIPSYFQAAQTRIESIRDRLGNEPAGALAQEIKVNRMAVVRFMKKADIKPYVRS